MLQNLIFKSYEFKLFLKFIKKLMTVFYIIIFIAFILFVLSKITYTTFSPKNKIPTPEHQAYFDAVHAKLEEPPEIIYGIDCLENERIPNWNTGRFQTALIEKNLFIPKDSNDFFYFEEMNGYQIGVTIQLVQKYFDNRNKDLIYKHFVNGDIILAEHISNGLRNYDYDLLVKAGNLKFDDIYRKNNGLSLKEEIFSINFISRKQLRLLLKYEKLSVKNIATNQFEKTVSYCEIRENHIPLVGGDFFQIFIGDTLIYRVQTLYR